MEDESRQVEPWGWHAAAGNKPDRASHGPSRRLAADHRFLRLIRSFENPICAGALRVVGINLLPRRGLNYITALPQARHLSPPLAAAPQSE